MKSTALQRIQEVRAYSSLNLIHIGTWWIGHEFPCQCLSRTFWG